MTNITAILVTYNSEKVIEKSLSHLLECKNIRKIIVVDNNSDDNTKDIIKGHGSKVKLIENKENIGFGRACNIALEKVITDFCLLINPDAEISESGIDRLVEVISKDKEIAIVGPKIPNKGLDSSSNSLREPVIGKCKPAFKRISDNSYQVNFVSGSIALWNMRIMKEVGFFDPRFFLFYEDDDISIRASKAGYKMILVDGIKAEHLVGRSSECNAEIESLKLKSSVKSYLYINRKYKGMVFSKYLALAISFKMCIKIVMNYLRLKLSDAEIIYAYDEIDKLKQSMFNNENKYWKDFMENNYKFIHSIKSLKNKYLGRKHEVGSVTRKKIEDHNQEILHLIFLEEQRLIKEYNKNNELILSNLEMDRRKEINKMDKLCASYTPLKFRIRDDFIRLKACLSSLI